MDGRPIRVAYFGTPAFAVPALRALHADPRFEVALVVSQPDRPAGRGRRLVAPPVRVAADELGLPVYQPERLRTADQRAPLAEAGADVFVVAAFGMIFGPKTLAIPARGCVNLHASLLPRWRGASPISAAIAAGDATTGVTAMLMDVGLDTGPMLDRAEMAIAANDTAESLTARLANLGGALAPDAVARWVRGEIDPEPQPETATLTRPLVKADGWLDWSRGAAELERHVRAMWPWPRAWTEVSTPTGPAVIQVHRAAVHLDALDLESGAVARVGRDVLVGCGDGSLRLELVQVPGGKPVPAASLFDSGVLAEGSRLGVEEPAGRSPMWRPT